MVGVAHSVGVGEVLLATCDDSIFDNEGASNVDGTVSVPACCMVNVGAVVEDGLRDCGDGDGTNDGLGTVSRGGRDDVDDASTRWNGGGGGVGDCGTAGAGRGTETAAGRACAGAGYGPLDAGLRRCHWRRRQ